ncbi:RES domain-containing protein [bacterium]|nr:MAG: RES domain-containing protein [bacterium]
MKFRRVTRGGAYYRVCDPAWVDPTSTAYAKRMGGRWNPRGAFGALYLSRTIDVAAANARRSLAREFGDAVTFDDLRAETRPQLLQVTIAEHRFVDACTDAGLTAVGLSAAYPKGAGYRRCQRVGLAAYLAGEAGIAARSAVHSPGEELALFDSALALHRAGERVPFARWYPGAA